MTFGQVPNATPQEMSSFVGLLFWIIGAIAGALVGLAALLQIIRGKSSGEQFVVKSELNKLESAINNCALKTDVEKIATTLTTCASKDELKDLGKELRDSIHRMSQPLQTMATEMASVRTLQNMQKEQIASLTQKVEGTHDILIEMRGLLKKNTPPPPTSAA